jgi:hypothetical protein
MPVKLQELRDAYEFVGFDGGGTNEAFLSKQSGKIYWRSQDLEDVTGLEDLEELPDDLDDENKYIPIPGKVDLDLGKPLVFDFVRQFLPDDFDEVQGIFSKSGAYGRYKDLPTRRRALDRWYDFESKATETALREWCEINEIEVSE